MDRADGDPHCRLAPENREFPVTDTGFVHVHSSCLLLEDALNIAKLAGMTKADRRLALTDTDNMFGALDSSEK